MALKDFFTLTEIKDGITAISRVKDLVDMINNDKDFIFENMDDTMRQWSIVANAIAATDNRECLDLFINLDGIHFIDRWLNNVQKVGTEKSESFVEELILVLLRAVEKLRLDNQKSISSGIWMTVKNLIGHSNLAVDERAKALFNIWKEDSMEIDVSEKKVTAAADDDMQKQLSEKPPESSLEVRLDATKLHDSVMEISEKLDAKEDNVENKIKEETFLKVSEGIFKKVESESAKKEDEQRTCHNHISSMAEKEENDDDSSSSDEVRGDESSDSDIFKPVSDSKNGDVEQKRSNIEDLDYGMVDPLELARQVAIEVEREMDCREASCSSSDKRPNSPNSSNGKLQTQTADSSSEKVENSLECSFESPPENDVESSPVSIVVEEAKEVVEKKEKGFCDFDLNEDVCFDDTEEQLLNPLSTPVSVVSASRAAAATGSPGAPLQFEGTFGFKGPTSTSAFRPASPRRSNEGSNSKQRSDFLDFDLNVVEYGDDKAAAELANQILFSSALPSGESSVEASSRRLDLDLNLVSDGGDAPLLGRLFRHNSPSPSSSSSTVQPLLRNIDLNLNDQPSFFNDSSDQRSFFSRSYHISTPGVAADESVISIMGARVEVNRTQNDRITMDPLPDLSLARTGSVLGLGSSSYPYAHTPIYGYNATAGQTPPTIPMYWPTSHIPYMVDSRGSHPFGQQQQPHLFIPSSSNGAGPSGHGFDLNTGGLMLMEGGGGGSRDTSGLRQFLNPTQLSLQPGSSSGKRKEADGGWADPYPCNYKHYQSPWK